MDSQTVGGQGSKNPCFTHLKQKAVTYGYHFTPLTDNDQLVTTSTLVALPTQSMNMLKETVAVLLVFGLSVNGLRCPVPSAREGMHVVDA